MERLDISRLRKNRSMNFKIGLILALSSTILAFNWTTLEPDYRDAEKEGVHHDQEPKIIRTAPEKPKTMPPPMKVEVKEILVFEEKDIIEEPPEKEEVIEPLESTENTENTLPEMVAKAIPKETPPSPKPQLMTIEKEEPFVLVAEEMPRFAGCEEVGKSKEEKHECSNNKLLNFLSRMIRYPAIAREANIEGTVVV